MHLIREFAPDAYEFALSSWSWIGIGDKTPRFASCFGDMFLESIEGWWFLDTVEGTLERRWNTIDTMFADLEGDEGRAEYLLEETLNSAFGQGLKLGEDEVFAFLPPPAVTGTMSVSSLAPLRFAIAANLAGRIHGELNGVQPDAGASALFAAQQFAAQQAAQQASAEKYAAQQAAAQQQAAQQQAAQQFAAQNAAAQHHAATPAFDTPNPPAGRWEPAVQQVHTGAYPVHQPTPPTPVRGYAVLPTAASTHQAGGYDAAGHEAGYETSGYETGGYATGGHSTDYTAGAELDYTAAGDQGYAPGTQTAAPTTSGYLPQAGDTGYDYLDNSHTLDSGQFSQYIADQYNTGQVAAVDYIAADYGTPAPARPAPRRGGHRSYA
ncbi:hypothetical protein AB1046_04655 [Promicromonospora sp. Populi]|uniref:hypothetical protein n=1 Tax=Promicromonospora sp. Populi TaxID=3239420 RepID=UPI0034E2CB1A